MKFKIGDVIQIDHLMVITSIDEKINVDYFIDNIFHREVIETPSKILPFWFRSDKQNEIYFKDTLFKIVDDIIEARKQVVELNQYFIGYTYPLENPLVM